jgi:membrane-bound lytic murein transglycosylase B
LAVSVSGDLLTDVYLQSRKSMIIEQAGGAQAKVTQVDVQGTNIKESAKQKGAVDIRTNWSVIGTVGHWGHIHTRQNVYDAILTLAVIDGSWKVTGIELLEEKRVDPFGSQSAK